MIITSAGQITQQVGSSLVVGGRGNFTTTLAAAGDVIFRDELGAGNMIVVNSACRCS
jgi:hypothetical protein